MESEKVDPLLSKSIWVIYISLVDLEKIPYQKIKIEEQRYDTTFLYVFENYRDGLTAYVGRDKTGQIKYLAMDKSRFKWAVAEGFIEDASDVKQRQFVYDKIGVLRELTGLMDFIKFLAAKTDYTFAGDYIKTEQVQPSE